MINTIKYVFLG